jgi:hypothetical protein
MKSLAKNVEERFQSMEDFRKALLGEVVVPAPGLSRAALRRPIGGNTPSPTTTLSPQAQSTTLSSATSEIDDEFQPPKRRTGLVVAIGALAVGAVVALVVLPKQASKEAAAKAAETSLSKPPSPAPPEPKTVTIRFEAQPKGAHVFRKSDDKDLGSVPLQLTLPKDSDAVEYVVRKDGYRELALVADLSTDRTLHVALDKVAAPPPPPQEKPAPPAEAAASKHKPTPAAHRARRTKGPAPDEDGLATPSF